MSTRSHELTVDGVPTLDVVVKSGSLTVRNGPADRVRIDIDAADSDAWTVTQNADQITIDPPPGRIWARAARVYVEAPKHTELDIASATADVALHGTFGAVRLKGATTDVAATGALVRLDASTASGDLRVDEVTGDVTCKTASGDAILGTVGGRLIATTASGDVRVTLLGGDAEIGTASGDVRVGRFDGNEISVRTASGRIAVGLPTGIRVQPELSTLSGHTRLPTPSSAPVDGQRRIVRVRLRSISGDIDISRA